ncbi:hypothetical protein HID58_054151 [Brassica napus]|uniref:Uncharacterized protein n=1 Tax=Brassica napus TaxID=3708 RepID=A0ABQ8AGQ7_BRANA|nr:hypothetical protein HID58_054151 [Brassica napus]
MLKFVTIIYPWGTFIEKKEMSTQEYLQDAMGNLSQVSHVTSLSSLKPGDWRTPTLKDMELPEDRVNDDDYSLVFVPEDSWAKMIHWCSTTKQHLKIGPSMYTTELAERVMGPAVWLQNQHWISYMTTNKGIHDLNLNGLI